MMSSIEANGEKAFSGKQISAFAENLEIEKEGIFLEAGEIDAYVEEVMYRKLACKSCVDAGACPVCKCPTPLKMHGPQQFCPEGKWQSMGDDPTTWWDFKRDMGITFKLEYN